MTTVWTDQQINDILWDLILYLKELDVPTTWATLVSANGRR